MKRTTKKLNLGRETIRLLGQAELRAAGGAGTFYNCVPPTVTAYQTGCDSGDFTDRCGGGGTLPVNTATCNLTQRCTYSIVGC